MANLAVNGIIIYLFLLFFMRIPELLILGLWIVLLLVGLAMVEAVGKAVWRLIVGNGETAKTLAEKRIMDRNAGQENEVGCSHEIVHKKDQQKNRMVMH